MSQRTVRILHCDIAGCTNRYVPDTYLPAAELRVLAMREQDWTARWARIDGLRVRVDTCGHCKRRAGDGDGTATT